jgi:hypothetical protein
MKMLNPQEMTMVVARYNENLNWLKQIPWNYIVYNKGTDLPEQIDNEIKLQNIGREAHSYLTYIVDNYEDLLNFTIFAQGNPFTHSLEFIRKINDFDGKADFTPLSDNVFVDNGIGQPNHPGLRVAESAQSLFSRNIESFEFPVGAQFIASKKAILSHSKLTYQKLKDFVTKAEPQPNEKYLTPDDEECPGYKNLFSSWTMERLWKILFNFEHKTIFD